MRWGAATWSPLLALALAGCSGGEETKDTTEPAAAIVREGNPARGREVFMTAGCGGCHTLAAAGSTRNAGPNLNEVARRYDAAFIRRSIVDPQAYREKGESGRIGGTRSYGSMPAYGPDEDPPQTLTDQQLADLVAFIESGAG